MPWYRILNPESEIKLLRNRESGIETIPSAFQYLRSGVPQAFFGAFGEEDGHVGITLKNDRHRNVLWRNSSHCSVSDDVFKRALPMEEFAKALASQNYVSWSERQVVDSVDARYKKNYDEAVREGITDKKEREEYSQLAWTEGIFKHGFSDIESVVIDPSNIKSCIKGYAFSKVLENKLGRKIDFVAKDEDGKGVKNIDRYSLKEAVLENENNRSMVISFIERYESCMNIPLNAASSTSALPIAAISSRNVGDRGGRK